MHHMQAVPRERDRQPTQPAQLAIVKPLQPKSSRRRGIILTEPGWQKLQQAQILCNAFGERHSYEYLSEQTLLDPRTVCRIISREVAIDKRSLKIFFSAFNLELTQADYTTPQSAAREPQVEDCNSDYISPASTNTEIAQLKQHIIESCRCFIQFLKLDGTDSVTLSVKFAPQTPPQIKLDF